MEILIRLFRETAKADTVKIQSCARYFDEYLSSSGKIGVLMVYDDGEPMAEVWVAKVMSNRLHRLITEFVDIMEADPLLYCDLSEGEYQAIMQESDAWVRGLIFSLPSDSMEYDRWFSNHCQWLYVTSNGDIFGHNVKPNQKRQEAEFQEIFAYACSECGAVEGDMHKTLCTSEICPFCGDLLSRCPCFYQKHRPGKGCERVADGSWALLPNFRIPVSRVKKQSGLDV